jgi:hypothetical protein
MTTTQTTGFSRKLRNLALAAALAVTSAGIVAAPALAADWHHDSGRGHHEWRGHGGGWWGGPYVAVTPGCTYYDPYYGYPYGYACAPAPVYAAPGVNVVLPIHIR